MITITKRYSTQPKRLSILFLSIILSFSFISSAFAGCRSFSGDGAARNAYADKLAKKKHFEKGLIKTKDFTLTTYHKPFNAEVSNTSHSGYKAETLTVYIEGDGRSWERRDKISGNPTPYQPLALKLALLDQNEKVAYLARPCQYTCLDNEKSCGPDIWTFQRFSDKVIANMNEAVSKLKQESGAKKINLVGFSGGAAVVVLVAARRNDVTSIKTVAGDLDHEMMTEFHQTSPMTESLNPKRFVKKVAHIKQWHYIGKEDPVVPSFISKSFVDEISKTHPNTATQMIFPKVSHHEGWEKLWPELAKQ